MKIVVLPTARDAADRAAHLVAAAVRRSPGIVLGLPTGRTPVPFYRALVARHRAGRVDFRRTVTFNLDEFVGLPSEAPGSYHAYMARHFFDHVNVPPAQRHLFDGRARDWRRETQRFEAALARAGGLDLVVLGLGANGHIGFNEPAASLVPRSHRARLSRATRRANAHLFGGRVRRVPRFALSMGMGTLLGARQVLLLATGRAKAGILARALAGPITTRVPASLLQAHPDATAIVDRAAAAQVSGRA
jgi:glucosamine-6-phosphate deaminase